MSDADFRERLWGRFEGAIDACNKQRGSAANIIPVGPPPTITTRFIPPIVPLAR